MTHMLPKPARGTAQKARRARKAAADRELAANAQQARWRDGDRCRVCRSTLDVQVHHITYRSRGGKHDTNNLVCLCVGCHQDVHLKRLTIAGNADGHLVLVYPARRTVA